MRNASERFVIGVGELAAAPCANCRHKHLTGPTCTAFPDGIPEVILDGRSQHRTPFPGDNDIRYEPVKPA
jgi:hypothetical protein